MDRRVKKWVFWIHSALLGIPGLAAFASVYELCWGAMVILFAGYCILMSFVTREIFGK